MVHWRRECKPLQYSCLENAMNSMKRQKDRKLKDELTRSKGPNMLWEISGEMITLYAKQKKRHRCTKQTFGLCGRRWGWDVSREQHQNMYIIYSETGHQPRWDAWDKCLGLVHWEDPEESGGEGGGRGGSGWGIHVTPWLIHVNVWKNPLKCCEVISLQLIKINEKKSK